MMMVETRAVTLSVERERRAPPALAGGSRSWPPINRRRGCVADANTAR